MDPKKWEASVKGKGNQGLLLVRKRLKAEDGKPETSPGITY
jgi:hypothetical protein